MLKVPNGVDEVALVSAGGAAVGRLLVKTSGRTPYETPKNKRYMGDICELGETLWARRSGDRDHGAKLSTPWVPAWNDPDVFLSNAEFGEAVASYFVLNSPACRMLGGRPVGPGRTVLDVHGSRLTHLSSPCRETAGGYSMMHPSGESAKT